MPNPGSARTAEDFVILLRQARDLSGLTYWELADRARSAGHHLEPATLVEALTKQDLPGEDVVVGVLTACGYSAGQIPQWLAVRARLAGHGSPARTGAAMSPGAAETPTGTSAHTAGLDEATVLTPSLAASAAPVPAASASDAPVADAGRPGRRRASGLDEPTAVTPSLASAASAGPTAATPSPASAAGGGPATVTRSLAASAVDGPTAAASDPGPVPVSVPGAGGPPEGQDLRRAPASLLRPLAMTLGAAVIGIGSVAVIVSAVNQGEAGPPVYAIGAPPRTAPVPQPSETPAPQGSASPDASAAASSPAVPPPPAPPAQPGVLRRGTATLQTGQSIDLDGAGGQPDIVVYGSGDSIRSGYSGRHFAAATAATKQSCAALTTYQRSMQDLTAGKAICVHTDKGHYAHITVTRTAPLAFSYVVWS